MNLYKNKGGFSINQNNPFHVQPPDHQSFSWNLLLSLQILLLAFTGGTATIETETFAQLSGITGKNKAFIVLLQCKSLRQEQPKKHQFLSRRLEGTSVQKTLFNFSKNMIIITE